MKPVRVGVIGIGHLGRIHTSIYSQLPEVEITFLCDIILKRALSLAKKVNASCSRDYRDGFSLVDAVSITVPTSLHYQIAKEFLLQGKDVLVEKPITTELKQAEDLIQLARKNSSILQVGHVERFNQALNAIKNIPGEIKFVECHRIGPFSRRSTDISVVLDLMIHDLDIILELLPYRIKKIEPIGTKVITEFIDIANAKITFENGSICNITSSRVSEEVQRKIRIFKEDCYISLDYQKQEVKIYRKIKGRLRKREIRIKKEQPLELELRSFINSVKNRTSPVVSGESAKKALALALKIEKKINATSILKAS